MLVKGDRYEIDVCWPCPAMKFLVGYWNVRHHVYLLLTLYVSASYHVLDMSLQMRPMPQFTYQANALTNFFAMCFNVQLNRSVSDNHQ